MLFSKSLFRGFAIGCTIWMNEYLWNITWCWGSKEAIYDSLMFFFLSSLPQVSILMKFAEIIYWGKWHILHFLIEIIDNFGGFLFFLPPTSCYHRKVFPHGILLRNFWRWWHKEHFSVRQRSEKKSWGNLNQINLHVVWIIKGFSCHIITFVNDDDDTWEEMNDSEVDFAVVFSINLLEDLSQDFLCVLKIKCQRL